MPVALLVVGHGRRQRLAQQIVEAFRPVEALPWLHIGGMTPYARKAVQATDRRMRDASYTTDHSSYGVQQAIWLSRLLPASLTDTRRAGSREDNTPHATSCPGSHQRAAAIVSYVSIFTGELLKGIAGCTRRSRRELDSAFKTQREKLLTEFPGRSNGSNASISRRELLVGATAATAQLATPAIVHAQPKALRIGVLLPRSGYMAPTGQASHRGAMIAPKVLADYGHRVELIHIDTESNVDAARIAAQRIINDGAHCIVGNVDSGGTLAVAQVCEQRAVPLVVNVGAAPQITEQGFKFVARNFPHAGMLMGDGLRPG